MSFFFSLLGLVLLVDFTELNVFLFGVLIHFGIRFEDFLGSFKYFSQKSKDRIEFSGSLLGVGSSVHLVHFDIRFKDFLGFASIAAQRELGEEDNEAEEGG
jgi:hypothetical protein